MSPARRTVTALPACLVLALGVAAHAAAQAGAPAGARAGAAARSRSPAGCAAFAFVHAGTPWRAQDIRRDGVSCAAARRLIESYARPRNCQFRLPCHIAGYVCRTRMSSGSSFRESCTGRGRSVAWRGEYHSH